MTGLVDGLRNRWTRWRMNRRTQDHALRCTSAALIIDGPSGRVETVPWDRVENVTAFKRDCYVVDSIRILFATSDGRFYEIAEHDEGWDELVAQLPSRLDGCLPFESWYFEVAFPAFETNWTPLYARQA